MNNLNIRNAYVKAEKRVNEVKNFYAHLSVYIIINILVFIAILSLRNYFYSQEYFILNLLSTPLIWGVILLIHGAIAFKIGKIYKKTFPNLDPFKNWEERKVKELMDKERDF